VIESITNYLCERQGMMSLATDSPILEISSSTLQSRWDTNMLSLYHAMWGAGDPVAEQ